MTIPDGDPIPMSEFTLGERYGSEDMLRDMGYVGVDIGGTIYVDTVENIMRPVAPATGVGAAMKMKLHGGPADGLEVDVTKPLQPEVYWQENIPVAWMSEEDTTITAMRRQPVHIYELQRLRQGEQAFDRYVHAERCCAERLSKGI